MRTLTTAQGFSHWLENSPAMPLVIYLVLFTGVCLVLPSFQPGLEDNHPTVVISEALGSHSSSLRPQFMFLGIFKLLHHDVCEVKGDNTSLPQTLFRCCDMSDSVMITTIRTDSLTPRSRQLNWVIFVTGWTQYSGEWCLV